MNNLVRVEVTVDLIKEGNETVSDSSHIRNYLRMMDFVDIKWINQNKQITGFKIVEMDVVVYRQMEKIANSIYREGFKVKVADYPIVQRPNSTFTGDPSSDNYQAI